ncbi:MAG: hypothetical protein FD126_3766, partial [Elusimicrobia bacterium]
MTGLALAAALVLAVPAAAGEGGS